MTKRASAISEAIDGDGPHPDGRRERSRSSRKKIIQAMMDLVAAGEISPSAAKVAEKAGVGLRSVFRHYEDKESIYREVDEILAEAYLPQAFAPFKSADWGEQLHELIERRAEIFEAVAPFRIATTVQRFSSPVLMENYRKLLQTERERLKSVLPARIVEDEHRFRAILLAMSFDTWRLFRQDEELSNRKTVEVTKQLLQDILDQIES